MRAEIHSTMLPSHENCRRAIQIWERIKMRFELSTVWRMAPPQVVATEFLSLLRFLLAPLRIEAALYDRSHGNSLVAATLPAVLVPVANDLAVPPSVFEFPTELFFAEGGVVIQGWIDRLTLAAGNPWKEIAQSYSSYLSRFPKPTIIRLPGGSLVLHLLVARTDVGSQMLLESVYAEDRVDDFIRHVNLSELLQKQFTETTMHGSEWRAPGRRLTSYLLDEFLDRLENELAILIGGLPSDIWVLLPNESGNSIKFHAPRQKLERLLECYSPRYDSNSASATVGALRAQVEDGNSGDFRKFLAPCQTGYHSYLSESWTDSTPLSVEHLECIAEKFQGWPVDRGIASSVVATGCGEVVIDFAKDYRVEAYSYCQPAQRLEGESESFYQVRLAERVFINIRPNVVEIPLLWGLDSRNQGRCAALLLVLFNGHDAALHPDANYFADRALSIRDAVEPWYLLFEHHGQSTEWNRVIRGHIVHEAKNAFAQIKAKLDSESASALENRLTRLWLAYSFVQDDRIPKSSALSVDDFAEFVKSTADIVLGPDQRFGYHFSYDRAVDPEMLGQIEIPTELIQNLLVNFIQNSEATLANLNVRGKLQESDKQVWFRVKSGDTTPSERHIVLEIEHRVTRGVSSFIRKYGPMLGRVPVISRDSQNRQWAHQGLFYIGSILRGCGGDFLRPMLHKSQDRVTWLFRFPLRKRSRRPAARHTS